MRWLVLSVALSVVLTVLLNVGLRVFPESGNRVARALEALTAQNTDNGRGNDRRVRVFVPWKAMILGSVILTILVNLLLRIT